LSNVNGCLRMPTGQVLICMPDETSDVKPIQNQD
jgi:hypothetical protein